MSKKISSLTIVLYHHRILSEALSHAVKMGIVVRNVAELVDPPRVEKAKMSTLLRTMGMYKLTIKLTLAKIQGYRK